MRPHEPVEERAAKRRGQHPEDEAPDEHEQERAADERDRCAPPRQDLVEDRLAPGDDRVAHVALREVPDPAAEALVERLVEPPRLGDLGLALGGDLALRADVRADRIERRDLGQPERDRRDGQQDDGQHASRRAMSFSMMRGSPISSWAPATSPRDSRTSRARTRARAARPADRRPSRAWRRPRLAQAHEPQPARVVGQLLLEPREVRLALALVELRALGLERGIDLRVARARVVRERVLVAGRELRVIEPVELDVGVIRRAVAELGRALVLARLDDVERRGLRA